MAAKRAPYADKRETSVEINAEPLSSDDEDLSDEALEDTPKSKRILEAMKRDEEKMLEEQRRRNDSVKLFTTAKPKSEKPAESRRLQKALQDDPMELTLASGVEHHDEDRGEVSDDGAAMLSWKQPSPKKRRIGIYHGAGAINIHASAPPQDGKLGHKSAPTSSLPSRQDEKDRIGLRAPDGFEIPSPAAQKRTGFSMPARATPSPWRTTRAKIKDQEKAFKFPDEIGSSSSVRVKTATFKLPSASISSSATTATSDPASTVFSYSGSSLLDRSGSRSRSSSASSLSSLDSIASLLLTQDEKDNLMTGDNADLCSPVERRTAQCPFCSLPVRSIHLEDFTIRFSKPGSRLLPSRLQQRFCREHRAEEARDTWTRRGYPTIHWTELATTRVDRHLPAIEAILRTNPRSSYYHAKLVEATANATTGAITGSTGRTGRGAGRSTLLKYLKEDILDVVKWGYYGPRGAKIAAEAITSRLSGALVEVADRDRLVRDCGAGGFVQAVLVPELIARWVAEDRALSRRQQQQEHQQEHQQGKQGGEVDGEDEDEDEDEDVIRQVLEESNEIGALVNEDEDVLVQVSP